LKGVCEEREGAFEEETKCEKPRACLKARERRRLSLDSSIEEGRALKIYPGEASLAEQQNSISRKNS